MSMRRVLFMLVLVGSLLGTGVVAGFAAGSGTVDPPPRIAFLANGHVPADALAAGPIAGQLGAPLYTTAQARLSEPAADGLLVHAPELVVVVGGPVAIADTVVEQLSAATGLPLLAPNQVDAGIDGIVRVAGRDRFATARAVAELINRFSPGFLPVDATALGAATAGDADTLDGLHATDLLADAPGSVTPTHLGVVPAARIEGQTAISSSAVLQFQNEVYDTDDLFDPSTPTTLTASIPGLYQVNAAVVFDHDTEGNRGLYIRAASETVSIVEGDPEKSFHGVGLQTSVVVPLVAGQGVTATAFESSPSASISTDPFAPRSTFLELLWVGPYPGDPATPTSDVDARTSPPSGPGAHGRVSQ